MDQPQQMCDVLLHFLKSSAAFSRVSRLSATAYNRIHPALRRISHCISGSVKSCYGLNGIQEEPEYAETGIRKPTGFSDRPGQRRIRRKIAESRAREFMDAYATVGGNLIDTGRIYGDFVTPRKGESEKIIGRWLTDRHCRERVFLSTKGGHPPLQDMQRSRLSREEIRSDMAESLQDLQTDYVDIFWLHRDDESRPAGEIMETLQSLIEVAHAVLYVRQMQTHALWRDVKVHNGTSLNQVKPVRVPDTPMKKKFFCKLREE